MIPRRLGSLTEQLGSRAWRLAITGASGIGKTTLAKALATQLNLEFIKEDIGLLLDAQEAINRLAREGELKRSHIHDYALTCQEQIERQNRAFGERDPKGFICDRFAIDVIARLLRHPFDRVGEDLFCELLEAARAQVAGIDLIIIPPLSAWAFQPSRNDMGRARNVAVLPKTRIHSLYTGLSLHLAPERTVLLPADDTRHEHWIPLVLAALSPNSPPGIARSAAAGYGETTDRMAP